MAHILIIDDDGGIRSFLQRVFEMKGHAVTTAAKGLDALRVFNRPVDLVITDMLMPHMDGLETIRCLKKLPPGLPMIAISGGAGSVERLSRGGTSHGGGSNPGKALQGSRPAGCRGRAAGRISVGRRSVLGPDKSDRRPALMAGGRTAQRRLPHDPCSSRCAAAADFRSGLAGKRSAAPVETPLRGSSSLRLAPERTSSTAVPRPTKKSAASRPRSRWKNLPG